MGKYVKKPIEIEAYQFFDVETNGQFIVDWAGETAYFEEQGVGIAIETLEGVMMAMPGDWVIKGIQGEFYPCRPDIFEATYEEVEDGASQVGSGLGHDNGEAEGDGQA